MKTIKQTTYAILIVLAMVFTGCSKEDDKGGGGGSAAAGTLTAKIDGQNFESSPITSAASKTNTSAGTTITISGSGTSGQSINLIIQGFDGVGTYGIGGGTNLSVNAIYLEADVSNPTNSQTWQAPFDDTEAGQIKISEVNDTSIKGTFSFKAHSSSDDSTVEITNGSFNMDFLQ